MTDFLDNRQIRIFISSTFRDMQAEREYLVTKVFPALRRYCDERDISIFELDLRWGISEEEAKQGKVFEICLNEVRKTKPFFIGLLGDRYGWVPTDEERKIMAANTNLFEDYPWIVNELDEGTSITEIEIQEGVLRQEEKINAYFYLRSPKMEISDEFREKSGTPAEKMLSELKKVLNKQDVYPVKEYDSIESLGKMVENDFIKLVDSLFPQTSLSQLEKERIQQQTFFKSRTRVYVPNETWYEKLDEFVDSTCEEAKDRALVVTGESGMGKSALLANWTVRRLAQNNKNEKIIHHFIGVSQSEGDYRKITQRLIDEVRDIYSLSDQEQEMLEENVNLYGYDMSADKIKTYKQKEELQNLFFSLPANEKLIIVLDGCEKLFDKDNAKLFNWLPPIPENVKFIFSTLPDDKSLEVFSRFGYEQLVIDVLPVESRKLLVVNYLKSFSKSLTHERVERLASDRENENPLALLSILDELKVFGIHEKIDDQITHYLSAEDIVSLFVLILQRIEKTFTAENVNFVRDILSLILTSRNGLSETEILYLSEAAPLYCSQLSNGMAGHLITMDGLVSFSNSIMRSAVKKLYLPNETDEQIYRRRIADYMETHEQVTFDRKCDELPLQLLELKEWDRLYNFLLNPQLCPLKENPSAEYIREAIHKGDGSVFAIKILDYIFKKDKNEIGNYWRILYEKDKVRYSMKKYLEFEDDQKDIIYKTVLSSAYGKIGYIIDQYIGNYSLSLVFALKEKEMCEKQFENKPSWGTALVYDKVADIYRKLNKFKEAVELFEQALEIKKEKCKEVNKQWTIADSYQYIGSCYSDLKDFKTAFKYQIKAFDIRRDFLGEKHVKTAISLNNIGYCYSKLNDYENALKYYFKAKEIREELCGKVSIASYETYNNIGCCYHYMKEYEKAIEYHKETITIKEKLLSKNHPDIADSYDNIGASYANLKDHKNEYYYHKEALDIRERVLGKEHLDTALSYSNIGSYYFNLGDYNNAIKYFYDAITVKEKILGKEHADIAAVLFYIGLCYSRLEDIPNSLKNYHESLEIARNTLGKEHSKTLTTCNNIGSVYYKAGEYQKALEYHLDALEIRIKINGEKHSETAFALNKVAMDYEALSDKEKALEYYQKAFSVYSSLGNETEVEKVKQSMEKVVS